VAPLDVQTAPLAEIPTWWAGPQADTRRDVLEAVERALEIGQREDRDPSDALYQGALAAEKLAQAMAAELPRLAAALDGKAEPAESFAGFLEATGDAGVPAAQQTRQDPAGLTVCRSLVRLALVLWWERVRGECLELAHRSAQPDALPLGYLQAIEPAHLTPGRALASDGSGEVLAPGGRLVARVRADVLDLVAGKLQQTRSVNAIRWFRWGLAEVTRRWARDEVRPEELECRGGIRGLAEWAGLERRGLQDVLNLGQHLQLQAPGWTMGGLWTWYIERGSRWGPGYIRWTWTRELVPAEPRRRLRGRDTYLVPLPPREPPLLGSRPEHGPQLALQQVFLAELRQRAPQLRERGGIALAWHDWRRLAQRVGLGTDVEQVVGAWLAGDDSTRPFLVEVEPNRYSLPEDLEHLLRFILEGLARSEKQRRRARRKRR